MKHHPYGHWSVMLLGSRGQIIQLHRFRLLFWVLGMVWCAAGVAAGIYYYRHQAQAIEIGDLVQQVAALESQVSDLAQEREQLLVRLAALETGADGKVPPPAPGDSPVADKDSPSQPPAPGATMASENNDEVAARPSTTPDNPVIAATQLSNPVSAEEPPSELKPQPLESDGRDKAAAISEEAVIPSSRQAKVSDFKVRPLPEANQLKIAYRLKNEHRRNGKLKGYTYVLLEGELEGVAHYHVVPQGLTAAERPPLQSEGHDFSVLNYITIQMTARAIKDYSWIRQATITVCSQEGNLLLKEQLPLTIE